MYKYVVFGLNILSDIEFEFQESEFEIADLSIVLKKAIDKSYVEDPMLNVTRNLDNSFTLDIQNVAVVEVLADSNIEIYPYDDNYHINELNLHILSNIMSFVIIQKGSFIIHGSSVNVDNKGVILTGEGGAGKSTLARGFINEGYSLISDDLSVVNDMAYLITGYPTQKLWMDSMANYSIEEFDKPIYLREDKYVVNIKPDKLAKKTKLHSVVLIESGEDDFVSIQKLSKRESLEVLINNTYRKELLEVYDVEAEHFIYMTNLVSEINVFRMIRPKEGFTVDEQIMHILDQIEVN